MKLLKYEGKKLIHASGFKKLCIGILIIIFLLTFSENITVTSPQKQQEHISAYDHNISYIIRIAEINRIDYTAVSGSDSYIVKYQEDIIAVYSSLLEKGITPNEVSGWNEYFAFIADDICLLLFAAISGVILTMTEWDNRTDTLLKTVCFEKRSIRRKLAVFALAALCFAAATTLVTLLGFQIRFGLSSPFVPLCSVVNFLYCPFRISIFQYLLISLLIKALNMFLLMLFSASMSNLFKSYIAPFFVSICTIAGGYGISRLSSTSGWTQINPYTLGITDSVFERYRSIDIFGKSVPVYIMLAIVLTFTATALCALFLAGYTTVSRPSTVSERKMPVKRFIEKIRKKLYSVHTFTAKRHSLFASEAKKSLIKSKMLILCAIMLCFKLIYAGNTLPQPSEYELYYRSICNEIAGPLTEEKRALIQDKLLESEAVISQREKQRDDFNSGLITLSEYNSYRNKLDIALADQFAYGKLLEQCLRIDEVRGIGIEAQLLYETGWQYFFNAGSDLLLYVFIMLFCCGIYAAEYNNGFDKIVCTTQRGMRSLHKAKFSLGITVAVISFAVFFVADLIALTSVYPLTEPSFSLASVVEIGLSMQLRTAFIAVTGIRLISTVILSVSICLLSYLLKKTYLSFPASVAVTALMYSVF